MSMTDSIEDTVEDVFPAPSFRKYQKKTIMEIAKGFSQEDKDVVLLNAPTGAGKSLDIHSAAKSLYELEGDESFITTPLNALVDQLDNDEFIQDDIITLKGRNNYSCVHEQDMGTSVDEAVCQRDSQFECDIKEDCPYYGRKYSAIEHPMVVTNLSYLMAEGMSGARGDHSFGDREYVWVDECQKIEDFAMSFISFTVSEYTVPDEVWQNIHVPKEEHEDDMEYMVQWLENEVLQATGEVLHYLDSVALLQDDQLKNKEKLEQFEMRVENFLDDFKDNDWVCDVEFTINKNRKNTRKAVFEPVEIGRFLKDLLWSRGDKIVLSSATIPGGDWLEEIGLTEAKVKKINVPSTFPVENRPIMMGHCVGKMTKDEREKNMLPMAEKIKQISDHHDGEKGFVHCRSYKIMEALKRTWVNNGYGDWCRNNVMLQDRYKREESLEGWFENDKQVFLSVSMDEGVDLEGDKCRWQVLAKTLYKHMGNKRVRYRVMERNEWDWYNRHAAIQLQQAYGRGVRSADDECVFYILDSSAKKLIQMNAELFNQWFLEAIQDIKIDPSRGR